MDDKPPTGDRRPRTTGGDRRPRTTGPGKPGRAGDRTDRPGNDRSRSDRPGGDRSRSDRPGGDRPRSDRPGSDRRSPDRPTGDRGRTDRAGSDRPRSDRPYGDRDRPAGDRSRSDRPGSDRSRTDRPGSDRPRSDRPGSDRPRSDRPGSDRPRSDRPYGDRDRDRPGDRDRARADRPRDPLIPEDVTPDDLEKGILLELRTLPEGLAEIVARHLVAADRCMATGDIAAARAHVEAARRRAGRVSAIREAAAIAAYADEDYAAALTELRAVRRMSGGIKYAPMIADCERGLGRPQKALDYIRAINAPSMDTDTRVELLLVAAGARADLGQVDAAVVTLQVPELTRLPPGTTRARLQYAYSDLLARAGRADEAWEWMERAAGSDIDDATDAADRCEELAGITFTQEPAHPHHDDPATERRP